MTSRLSARCQATVLDPDAEIAERGTASSPPAALNVFAGVQDEACAAGARARKTMGRSTALIPVNCPGRSPLFPITLGVDRVPPPRPPHAVVRLRRRHP